MKRTLVVMVKQPRPGRVKTRLGRGIGRVAACWWFRHQVSRLLRQIHDPRWQIVLSVAPDTAVAARDWPGHLPRVAQGTGDLGERMLRAMRATSVGPVCLVGGDVPGITRDRVWRAFQALGDADAVFGPASDGGFWLIGLSPGFRSRARALDSVRWSTAHTLADTRARVGADRVALVDMLDDVDEASDLRRG